jgi:tyrosyl-DNA phosphodiesterase 2
MSFQICLATNGSPSIRKIVTLNEDYTLQDVYRVATEVFGTSQRAAAIDALKYGFPPQTLEQSSSISAQSVLKTSDRVLVILSKQQAVVVPAKAKKRSAAAASTTDSASSTTTKKTKIEVDTKPQPLKVLSWNIAECQPSNDAPSGYDTEAAICRELIKHNAHVLCLQECPSPNWKPIELLERCYQLVGATPSHCGYVQLWIRQVPGKDNFFYQRQPLSESIPSVAAILLFSNNQSLAVSSSHLAPFKDNAPMRLQQVEILTTASNIRKHAIHAGDFNMRKAEDKQMEGKKNATHILFDAWKIAGSSKQHEYTWNSLENQYHANGFGFKCRFDRMYFTSSLFGQNVDFQLVANKAIEKQKQSFYLSDHYGIMCTVQVPAEAGNEASNDDS